MASNGCLMGHVKSASTRSIFSTISDIHIHWASKETYHFFKKSTKIHAIKINNIWTQTSFNILLNKNIWKTQDFLASKRKKMRLNHERSFWKIAETTHRASSTEAAYSEHSIAIHSISMAGYVNAVYFYTGYCLLRTPSPRGKQFLWFLKIDLLRFHHIYLLFDWSKLFFLCAY